MVAFLRECGKIVTIYKREEKKGTKEMRKSGKKRRKERN